MVSFCENGGFRLISRAIAAYRSGATLLRHNSLCCAAASASHKQIVESHWPNSDLAALLVELSMSVHSLHACLCVAYEHFRCDQTWPVPYCEEASSALFDATETAPTIVKSIVEKQLCASLVSTAAAMSEHSCSTAVFLLRVCCKCVQVSPLQTVQQLQSSTVCQRLTTILKISSFHRDLKHVNATCFESLRMYSSMLLVSLASELGEAVLQVGQPVPTLLSNRSCPFSASVNAQQCASHLRRNKRQLIHQLGFI